MLQAPLYCVFFAPYGAKTPGFRAFWCVLRNTTPLVLRVSVPHFGYIIENLMCLFIQWAAHGFGATIEHMGIDHSCLYIFMP